MSKAKIKSFLKEEAEKRMSLLGITIEKLNENTDLVKEGFFDSLSFVDLITDCESKFGVEIDLEKYSSGEFTKVGKLIEIIHEAKK